MSEFPLICFCAIYWIFKFREVLLLGPDTLITKPRRASPSCQCVQMHLVPIGQLKTQIVCQYTSENLAMNPFKPVRQETRRRQESLCCCWLRKCIVNVSASWCCGGQGRPTWSWEVFLVVFKFKDYTCRKQIFHKGFSRLRFVVVLSKFLMIMSQDHSLLYWKLGVGVGWLVCW